MRRLALILVVALAATGCDTDVTAVLGTDMPFTVYGLLSPDLATQKALVYPIENSLRPRGDEAIDASVRSINLTTGEELNWVDSLVVDSTGLGEHVFAAPFQAEYEHTYRLMVTRSDGAATTVEATVPPEVTVETGAATVLPGIVTFPAHIVGGAPNLFKVVVEYFITFAPQVGAPTFLAVPIDYEGRQELREGTWVVTIDLDGDYPTLERAAVDHAGAVFSPTYGLRIQGIRLKCVVASAAWVPPDQTFDPEVIVQPGTMSNVENGYGFLGAGYRVNAPLTVPRAEALEAAGFTPTDG